MCDFSGRSYAGPWWGPHDTDKGIYANGDDLHRTFCIEDQEAQEAERTPEPRRGAQGTENGTKRLYSP